MTLPLRKIEEGSVEDTYHLRPDGGRFAVVRGGENRVEIFAPGTGKRVSSVVPKFPGDDFLDIGLGWSKRGSFQVRGYDSERVYNLDLATGKLWRRER